MRSEWVKAEAMAARERGILVPVKLDDAKIPLPFGLIQTTDLGQAQSPDVQQALIGQLLDAMSTLVSRPVTKQPGRSTVWPIMRHKSISSYDWMHIFFGFSGRLSRKEMLLAGVISAPIFFAFYTLIDIGARMQLRDAPRQVQDVSALMMYFLFTLPIGVALFNKRLHDFGWSGWWCVPLQILWFVAMIALTLATPNYGSDSPGESLRPGAFAVMAVINVLTLLSTIILLFRRGNPGPNRSGPPPPGG